MRSQLSPHPLVALLGQCARLPRCRAQAYSQAAFRSLKSLHFLSQPHHRRLPPHLRHRRPVQTHPTPYRTYGQLSIPTTNSHGPQYAINRWSISAPVGSKPELVDKVRVAILGGGLTGLITAHWIVRTLRGLNVKVTIYEAQDKLGGWVQSDRIDVGDGKIILEAGPRSLLAPKANSPKGWMTATVIQQLGLDSEVLMTMKDSDAARNRFIYYPDRLVKMPGSGQDIYAMLWSLLTEPVYKGLFRGIIHDIGVEPRPATITDESVASFFYRRFGNRDFGDNIVSALLHGIYAGDINQLSMKSLFPQFWELDKGHTSLLQTGIASMSDTNTKNYADPSLNPRGEGLIYSSSGKSILDASTYTFKDGLSTLCKALEKSLRAHPDVEFKVGQPVTSIEKNTESKSIDVRTDSNDPPIKYHYCISALPAHSLSALTPLLPSLEKIHSVTVMVVSLYYSSSDLLPEPGFGYLIPRSIPYDQNPECALGVSFDSFSSVGQDTVSGTKVTVMLGGHWWDNLTSYPDKKDGVAMAKRVLRRHLGIRTEPQEGRVGLKRNCIPQYHVGHADTVNKLRSEVKAAFQGELIVTGNAFTGVGVHDCVDSGLRTSEMLGVDIVHRMHAATPSSKMMSNAPPPFSAVVAGWPQWWDPIR